MSGHSKWSTIKHKKAANDAKRGAAFTRLAREIAIAARNGGGDIEMNFSLRLAVEKARKGNMPKENIERAIKRGTGEDSEGAIFEEIMYEAYVGHGIAVLIEAVTDNRNRTISEVKHAVSKLGGSMAEPGAVAWQFEQKGVIAVSADRTSYDDLFMIAADAGAEDVTDGEDVYEITTPREQLHTVVTALEKSKIEIEEAGLEWVAKTPIDLDVDAATKVMRVIEGIEELDDTQNVFSNLNITDDVIAALAD